MFRSSSRLLLLLRLHARHSSHAPYNPSLLPARRKTTLLTLQSLHARRIPITMMTAHDFPSALAADLAGMDMILVGDSLAMVSLGHTDTNRLTLDAMVQHCAAVARGAPSGAFLVGDLPMGSYEASTEHAVTSALRLVQEGRMSAVKLEGGREMAPTIRRITEVGIPVLGHVGLTPQRSAMLGGFRVQGKSAAAAERVLDDARALVEAGVFGMVLEAVPEEVAAVVTEEVGVITIGIGAGKGTSGQVLVQNDMLGVWPEGKFMPKFVKVYRRLFEEMVGGIREYREDVRSGRYPESGEHTYPMKEEEAEKFKERVESKKKQARGVMDV